MSALLYLLQAHGDNVIRVDARPIVASAAVALVRHFLYAVQLCLYDVAKVVPAVVIDYRIAIGVDAPLPDCAPLFEVRPRRMSVNFSGQGQLRFEHTSLLVKCQA
ncbi:MAG: hypothetical protein EOO38_00845 [Cytophagaceae bacterium]|nr:MAG: hypothetical protein EOO38_00845 [Cytophagaceae bacterium]